MSDDVEMTGEVKPAVKEASKEVDSNDKLIALAAHLGPFSGVGYFFLPLIIYLVKKDSAFVSHHARQAMVYQGATGILMSILGGIGFVLTIFTGGLATLVVLPGMVLAGLLLCIPVLIAAYNSFNGKNYPYPVSGPWAEKLGS